MALAKAICYVSAVSEGLTYGELAAIGPGLKVQFHLTNQDLNIWMAVMTAGQVAGAILAGQLAHRHGCLSVLRTSLAFIVVGVFVRAHATSWPIFLAGGVIGGMAASGNAMTIIQYLTEVSTKASRGNAVTIIELLVIGGTLLAAAAAFLLVGTGPEFWRYTLLVCAVPPACALLLLVCFQMLESPRYLQRTAGAEVAAKQLADLLGCRVSDTEVHEALESWENEARQRTNEELDPNRKGPYREMLCTQKGLASLVPNLGQGCCGMSVFAGFVGIILADAGMPPHQSLAWIVAGNVVNLVSTGISSFILVDRLGRRPLLLVSPLGIGMVFAALLVFRRTPHTWIVALLMALGRIVYGYGLGPVPYVYLPEVVPNSLRSVAISVGRCSAMIGVVVSVNGGMVLLDYSLTVTYSFFLCINVAVFAGVYLFCPETLGLALEHDSQGGKTNACAPASQKDACD